MPDQSVLVTGGSGFIAGHVILQLLEQGHEVRATLRSLAKEARVRELLRAAGLIHEERLTFTVADLLADEGWSAAADGVDHVIHVASPVLPGHVADEDEVIVPARMGTLRVLRAARDAGVKRVVLTSAFHAVGWGHPHDDHVFTEADWTVVDGPGVDAYGRAKTLAERDAWAFVDTEGGEMELATMLPVAVMGPMIGDDVSGANYIIQRMLRGAMPAVPKLFIPVVDVRDVASAHLLAMASPHAAGERFLLSNGPALSLREIAETVRAAVGEAAARVPTRTMPDFLLRTAALFRPKLRPFVPDLGYARRTSNEKATHLLGWVPRDPQEAIRSAAKAMVEVGSTKP